MVLLNSRIRLSQDTTFYVRKDGSDLNDGLTDSPSGALQTIGAALAHIRDNVDACYRGLVVQVGPGTFNEALTLPNVVGADCLGWPTRKLCLRGNVDSLTTTTLNAGAAVSVLAGGCYSAWVIEGFTINSSVMWFEADAGSRLYIGKNRLTGNAQYGIASIYSSFVEIIDDLTVTSSTGLYFMFQKSLSKILWVPGKTLTFTGPITYSGPVVVSDENGVVQFSGINVVGGQNVSGVRYQASNGGGIDTGQGGETCIPGTAQGIKMNDGWYN